MIEIRPEIAADIDALRQVVTAAFGQTAESLLVDDLRESGDLVLSLVAVDQGSVVGHVGFSRLLVEDGPGSFDAVALAPLAVHPDHQNQGVGKKLVLAAHDILSGTGELLSVVLGDPDYYGRFGYRRDLAAGFESAYQSDFLLALGFGDGAPRTGLLRYAPAFAEL
jgi:putative acetyltransferase